MGLAFPETSPALALSNGASSFLAGSSADPLNGSISMALGVAPEITAQFMSSLQLNEAQEKELVRQCLVRITELRREMGLTEMNDVEPGSWMWLRKCHEAYFQNDLSWRLAFGGIFLHSNLTLGSGLRHVRYNSARVQDDLLGTMPFMAALAAKQGKEELAKQVENVIQTEVGQSNVRSGLRQAQKVALYRNECVVKTGWLRDTTPYIGEATVLVDFQTGEPITTPDTGDFVYEHSQTIPVPGVEDMVMLEEDPTFIMAAHPEAGVVTIPPYGDQPQRLARYQYFPALPQTMVHREGVFCKPIDYRSFLCPLKVESIHEADTVVHLYMETPSRLQKLYGGIDVSQQYFSWWNQPGQDKPKYEQGEKELPTTQIYQQIVVAEVYRRCDPDQTGEDKEILLVLDLTNQKPIYYNYLANHMGKRPFESIPGVEQVPGRWYGRGIYGMLDSHLFYEDVELSRAFFKNSQDATIQFAYKDAVDDWKNGLAPVIGSGDTYWVKSDWNPEGNKKLIWRESLASNVQPDERMMNIMRQSADSLVGAISTASASESDFNQSKTATGNQLVQQASDVITKATEQEQSEAITACLQQVVDVVLEHLSPKTLAADPATGLLAVLSKQDIRGLSKDVRLLLTRSKSTQLLNTSTQALAVAKDYRQLRLTDPQGAKDLRPLYISQLKGLEAEDADLVCPEVTDDEIKAFAARQQQGSGKPQTESVSMNYKDTPDDIRRQIEEKAGFKPSTMATIPEAATEDPNGAAPVEPVAPIHQSPLPAAGTAVAP